jgi:methylmalonyl-CoA carboxyltransferase large subunit
LETAPLAAPQHAAPLPEPARVAAPSPAPVRETPEISEEELIAISAALAAYLGVRVHIRQIRLIGSRAWAQEGRVSIQASHRLHS